VQEAFKPVVVESEGFEWVNERPNMPPRFAK
jgi:hypothetical protein